MSAMKLLTDAEIERRLVLARDAEKKARAKIAQLKRASVGASRRAETQRLCTLGRALTVMCERDERFLNVVNKFLAEYISRDIDIEILRNTQFEIRGVREQSVE